MDCATSCAQTGPLLKLRSAYGGPTGTRPVVASDTLPVSLKLSPNTYIAGYGAPAAACTGATGLAETTAAATSCSMKLNVDGWLVVSALIGAVSAAGRPFGVLWSRRLLSVDIGSPRVVAATLSEVASAAAGCLHLPVTEVVPDAMLRSCGLPAAFSGNFPCVMQ